MIDFTNVSKSFGTHEVLRDASFRVNDGERVGVVGPNGAGKSTVFALILRDKISPDHGSIELPKSVRIGHLRQEFNPHEVESNLLEYAESGCQDLVDMHAEIERLEHDLHHDRINDRDAALAHIGRLQTMYEAGGGYQTRTRAQTALCGLGLGEDKFSRPFNSFSGGWQMRAELARVIVSDPDLLLLDEPTNYLDIPAVEWLREYLKSFTGTMLLISHDRYLLNTLADTTLEVANYKTEKYRGNYDYYVSERILRYEQRLAAARNQQKEREQAQIFINRFHAKNTKAALVKSKMKMLDRMEVIEIPHKIISPGSIRLKKPERSGQEVVSAEDIGLTYDGLAWVLKGVSLSVQRGEKIAFVGLNGTGKSTFLRILAGILPPSEGTLTLGHNVLPGYQSQEFAETMDPDLTVYETVSGVSDNSTMQEVRNLLGGFGFSGNAVKKKVSVLSGGEKIRLAFAKLLINPPNFLILDEPTTHLDIAARESLEAALSEFQGTICIVSHDIQFVRKVATKIAAMNPPCIKMYSGGYDYYCEKMLAENPKDDDAKEDSKPKESERKIQRRERAEIVQERGRRKREMAARMAELEKLIDILEAEEKDIVAKMEIHGENADYAGINRRLYEIHIELPNALHEWEQASKKLEKFLTEEKQKSPVVNLC
jgi:ATP-binding cassette subfamily F protein 3